MTSDKNEDGVYDTEEGKPLWLTMRDIYLLAFGEFDLDDLSFTEWCLFIFSTILIQIMLLNLLIAILSETFSTVMGQIDESDMMELNNLIIDATALQPWNRSNKTITYLHWVEYKYNLSSGEKNETLEAI